MYRKLFLIGLSCLMTLFVMTPIAHAQAKITGPWLWMIAPTAPGQGGANSINVDSLAVASGGAVTEADVAANGANEGDRVGNFVWTLGQISATGSDNINDCINRIGLAAGNVDDHSSYALFTLESDTVRRDAMMRVGSDDAIKVWLNGEVVHNNPVDRGASDFQDAFRVDLVAGDNLLMVKVSERGGAWSMFVGIDSDGTAGGDRGTGPTDLNVGEPYTVRLIYFLPSDRQSKPDIDTKMDTLIKDVQQLYADTMESHGFGRKTFRIETDTTGKAVVHHVNGKFNDAYYQGHSLEAWEETNLSFDMSNNIYLVALDISSEILNNAIAAGYGSPRGVAGGQVLIPASGRFFSLSLTFHELAHAFGLNHDYRDVPGARLVGGSACACEWLNVHPYFNTNRQNQDLNNKTTIEMSTPSLVSPPNAIRLRFEVTDFDGLHQAQLFTPESNIRFNVNLGGLIAIGGLIACKRLNGTNTIVEFVTTELTPSTDFVWLNVIDVHGNFSSSKKFPIDITSLLPPPKVVSIPDANLATAVRHEIDGSITMHTILDLKELDIPNCQITDLTGLEHAHNLKGLNLGGEWISMGYVNSNEVSDFSPLEGLTKLTRLSLNNSNISDISSLAGLTNLILLRLSNNNISDISALAGLTQLIDLRLSNNNISDISALAGLTQLIDLRLHSNSITHVSSLAGLTQLILLNLSNNNISDISALAGLTQLTGLWVYNNNISDISALAGLTQLIDLRLSNNNISDISALAGLTQLTWLYLWGNAISDVSPLLGLNLTGTQWDSTGLYLQGNPLSYASIHTHIPAIQAKGIEVKFDNRTPTKLVKISEAEQQATVNAALPHPFVVEVRDERNRVFSGVPVTFVVTAGGGTLSATRTTTDNNGRAQSTLTLGPNPGTNTVEVSAAGIEPPVTFNAVPAAYLLPVPAGISLIHVPLKVTAVDGVAKPITSISDLYDALGGADTVNLLGTRDPKTQRWFSYADASDKGTSDDPPLTDDKGIIASMKTPVEVRLHGDALGTNGHSSITLFPGLNLVGVPLKDSRIARVSDLFALAGIGSNVSAITVSDNGEFLTLGQAGDEGDIPITGGQSFILRVQEATTVAISGSGWYNTSAMAASSPVAMMGIEVGDTTPILAVRGSIVSPVGGWGRMPYLRPGSGFRVIVKNLSIGRSVSTERRSAFPTVTGDEKEGYRLTMVDVETGRAAMIGDILEVSVQSPSPLIGVQPLRYTVTAEDVLRSRVELADLVAYEIPTETELLRNYPNPFNPETWIPYRLAEDAFVMLTIYDGSGRVVRTLEVGHRIAAVYESRSKAIYWDGRNGLGEWVASGLYFYHLLAEDYSATRRMVVVK